MDLASGRDLAIVTLLSVVIGNCVSNEKQESPDGGVQNPSGDSDADSDSGSDSDGDSDAEQDAGYENTGICGTAGQGVVSNETFQGTEDRYLIANEGGGVDICRIRYTLRLVGEPRTDCSLCDWAFDLEIDSDVTIFAEEQSGCAGSSLGFDESTIAGLIGERVSYGYVDEYMGHESVIMQYRNNQWEAVTFASWNPDTGELSYDRKDGTCGY